MTAAAGVRRAMLWTGALTAAVAAFMLLTSMRPNLVLVAGLGALIGAVVWLLSTLWRTADPPTAWDTAARPVRAYAAGSPHRWSRYRVPAGARDLDAAERLYATLIGLLDDRLAAHHGVDRERDPEAARAILGDDLARFAGDPRMARALTRLGTVERVVARIEQL